MAATTTLYRKKVCLLGEAAVGKTSLVRRAVLDQFSDEYLTTLGAKVLKKQLTLDRAALGIGTGTIELSLSLWDIIGQLEFRELSKHFYKESSGAILVVDLTRPDRGLLQAGRLRDHFVRLDVNAARLADELHPPEAPVRRGGHHRLS